MTTPWPSRLLLHLHPSDRAVATLLAISVVLAAVRLPSNPGPLRDLLLLQTAMLAGFIIVVAAMMRWERNRWVQLVRPAVTVTIIFTCYTSLGKLGMAAMPFTFDAALAGADTWLCGVDPSLAIEPYLTSGRIEFFSFFYGAFIPYIYVTIVLNCLGRPPLERDQFLTGWVSTYCISYLGYMFLPATGPLIYDAAEYQLALSGGYFYHLVLSGVEASGGMQGAFPSLHVGGSLYLCLFELRTNRLRGLVFLPLVLLIYVATVVLRYHYVVDLVAGTVISASCLPVGRAVFEAWAHAARPMRCRPCREGKVMLYRLCRLLAWVMLRLFFRRIEVDGLSHVPAQGPLLFAPNHTNSLVDPLVMVITLRRRLTLTAKNVLGKNRLLGAAMARLGVITFHRREDVGKGADRKQNVHSLESCRQVLRQGGAICLFPEGVSHSDPHLRTFRTGIGRLALDYVRDDGNNGTLRVVPTGLIYTDKDKFRSGVLLSYGEALDVGCWLAEHPDADARALTEEIRRLVEDLTLQFETRREALILSWAADILASGGAAPAPLGWSERPLADDVQLLKRLQAGYRSLATAWPQEVEELTKRVRHYRSELKRLAIDPREVYLPLHVGKAAFFLVRELELLAIGAPLALFGAVDHLVPYLVVKQIAKALSTDKDHWATNVVYPSFVVFPLCYTLQIAAAWWLLPGFWAVLYVIALPYTGWVALLYGDRATATWRRLRTFLYFLGNRGRQDELAREGRAIIAGIRELSDKELP